MASSIFCRALLASWRQVAAGRPIICATDERHAEHVVQDEHDPLGRAEPLQHDEQGQLDVVVEGDPVGRVGGRRRPTDGWPPGTNSISLASCGRSRRDRAERS